MSPLQLLEKLKSEYKTEDTVFIIGGGPSVLTTIPDPRILDGHDVICANNAYKLFPNAMLLHFADKIWWDWHQKPQHMVKDNFNGMISSCHPFQRSSLSRDETRVVCFQTGDRRGGISPDPKILHGGNTGHQAINIATHLGYEQIVLVGFDLQEGKQTHWHNQHERPTVTDNFVKTMKPGFELLAKHQDRFGIKIYNLNPDSAIRCFDFAKLDDFI